MSQHQIVINDDEVAVIISPNTIRLTHPDNIRELPEDENGNVVTSLLIGSALVTVLAHEPVPGKPSPFDSLQDELHIILEKASTLILRDLIDKDTK